ncbi:MAG: Ig-like domain-containing protein [Verrucomicrobiales bacterium]
MKDYIMHRTLLLLIALIGMLCCLAPQANAGSRQGHGIILTVNDDDENRPPTINVQGVFASHFSGQRFLPWTFRLTLNGTGEKTGKFIYVVDGLLVPDTIGRRALVPGRRAAWSEDVIAIQTFDEVSDLGIVKSVNGDEVTLTKMENAEPGYGKPAGSKDLPFAIDADATYWQDNQSSDRATVLAVGNYVRRIGACAQTVNVIEPTAAIRSFPGAYVNSCYGTITGYDPKTRKITALAQGADGSVSERQLIARKHVSLDSHYLPRTAESSFRLNAAFEPGREAFFFCHRGSTDPNEVYVSSVRPGEVKGRLVSATDNSLTVAVWQDGAFVERKVALDADARIRWNYQDADRATALRPGAWVHMVPASPMRLLAGRWDSPIKADEHPAPVIKNIAAKAIDSASIRVTWDDAGSFGGPTVAYAIYRDGEQVGTSFTTEFIDTGLSEKTSHSYTVRGVSRWGGQGGKAAAVSAQTPLDTTAPTLVEATADSDTEQIALVFDKPMAAKQAQTASNYRLTGGTISAATLSDDGLTVKLTTSGLEEGKDYTLTVSGLVDATISKNAYKAAGSLTMQAWPVLQITEISVPSGNDYKMDQLAYGMKPFFDRKDLIDEMPEGWEGLPVMRTYQDDKKFDPGEAKLTFRVNRPVIMRVVSQAKHVAGGLKFRRLDPNTTYIRNKPGAKLGVHEIFIAKPGAISLPSRLSRGRDTWTVYILVFEPATEDPGASQE